MGKKSSEPIAAELSFEGAQARLREVVQKLEDPNLPLEESLGLFEEGSRLAKHCQALLDKAEARIEVLLSGDGGTARTEPLGELEPGEGRS